MCKRIEAEPALTAAANAGYRAIATKHHPDKGGSQETMARLNRARDHLKRMA